MLFRSFFHSHAVATGEWKNVAELGINFGGKIKYVYLLSASLLKSFSLLADILAISGLLSLGKQRLSCTQEPICKAILKLTQFAALIHLLLCKENRKIIFRAHIAYFEEPKKIQVPRYMMKNYHAGSSEFLVYF